MPKKPKYINPPAPVALGEKYSFRPACFSGPSGIYHSNKALTGRVIAINEAHRHFTVAAELNGYIITESFKF